MKKLAFLLAVLMLLSIGVACKKEQPGGSQAAPVNPVFQIPGRMMEISLPNGWKAVAEESQRYPNQTYLELTNGSAQLLASAYGPGDTVDPIPAEDIMYECNEKLFSSMKDLTVKEEQKSYSASGKNILTARYTAKEGDATKEFYCFVVSFEDGSECQVWLCFIASSDYMNSNKDAFKGYAEGMTCSELPADAENEDALEFDENGNLIENDGTSEETFEETTEVPETTESDESTETTGESTETTGESTETTGESTETTGESTETTGETEATVTASTN